MGRGRAWWEEGLLNVSEQMFKTVRPIQEEQLSQMILKSKHKCRSYGPDKPNFLPFYHLTFKCDLDL